MRATASDAAPHPSGESAQRLSERALLAAAFLLAVALALRGLACLTELWLDEIWSLRMAARVTSPFDVLLTLRHDNNHPLNTLLLAWIGPVDAWVVYRLPALLTSLIGVALAGALVRRRGEVAILVALLLCSSSALLIQYASEARGYAPAFSFALAAIVLIDPERSGPRGHAGALRVLGFGACVLAAALSHVNALGACAAGAAWRLFHRWRAGAVPRALLADTLRWHALPALGVFALWAVWLHDLQIGGGPHVDRLQVVTGAASFSLGLPLQGGAALIGAAVFTGLLLGGLVWLARTEPSRWVLYALGVVVLPAAALLATRPLFLAPRYFLPSAGLFLLLLAEMADAAWRAGGARRVACAVGLTLFVLANALQLQPLLRDGRGEYLEALTYMVRDAHAPVRIASDHDLRTGMVVRFYARYFERDRPVRYVDRARWSEQGADWFVLERTVEERHAARARGVTRVPPFLIDPLGNRYRLERAYAGSPLSGIDWFLYRNTRTVAP